MATICMFLQNLVVIGWTVAELLQIIDFQYGGRPPSWIRVRMRGTTHEVFYMVFITVQN